MGGGQMQSMGPMSSRMSGPMQQHGGGQMSGPMQMSGPLQGASAGVKHGPVYSMAGKMDVPSSGHLPVPMSGPVSGPMGGKMQGSRPSSSGFTY